MEKENPMLEKCKDAVGQWTHVVSAKKIGDKKVQMVGSGGRTTRLKVHAIRMSQGKAETLAAQLTADNPGWEFKAKKVT